MDKNSRDPVHCWLVLGKAFHAAAKYLYAGLEETGIDDTDFRILEVLLNKGPLPVNTIGPKVNLRPGSISTAVDRLVDRGLVSRVESPEDRRVRGVAHCKRQRIDRADFSQTRSRNQKNVRGCKCERVTSTRSDIEENWQACGKSGDRYHSKAFKPTMTYRHRVLISFPHLPPNVPLLES